MTTTPEQLLRLQLETQIVSALDAFSACSSSASHDETCRAIERYVDALRAAKCTPERVVIALKDVTRRAGFREPKDPSLRQNMPDRDRLAEQFISCGIRRYFSTA
jgi:hypothetical protein